MARSMAACLVLSLAGLAAPLGAQARPAALDSVTDSLSALADRVARAEEQLRMLRQQLAQVAREKAGTSSRAGLEFSGRVMMNAFLTNGRTNLVDVPTIALPAYSAIGTDPQALRGALGGTFRQSVLTVALDGRPLWGGTVRARADADFFGGVQEGAGGRRLFPEPRLRVATASMAWTHARVTVGQDVPLVTDVTPWSTAAFGLPLFASAGNLWFWLPQVRIGAATTGALRLAVDAAAVAPWTGGDPVAGDTVDRVDAAERSRRPFLQGRVGVEWGEDAMAGRLAVGAHHGWIARPTGVTATTSAVTVMLLAPLTEWLEVRGVAYRGQALRGLGGGGVSQNFAPDGTPLRDVGGWAQLLWRPALGWQVGAGCGVSDPDNAQSPVRRHNRQCEAGLQWRPGGLPVLGLAYRRVATDYAAGLRTVQHLNFVTGVEF
ncbi:MAG: hypothetical protein ACK53A_03715 [Gemmatimonadota bacterium]|nr:hypothetical protein [Gemmatimonadota bacterium]